MLRLIFLLLMGLIAYAVIVQPPPGKGPVLGRNQSVLSALLGSR